MYTIVVHGGAGRWPEEHRESALQGVGRAVEAGLGSLSGGGSALDAVVMAVMVLEEDPVFNAGTGSVLNLDGEVEMDAGVMVSRRMRSGNVAAVRGVRNPVRLAREVMERTSHVMLAGRGAERFARAMGHRAYDAVTEARRQQWRERRQQWDENAPGWADEAYLVGGDTVGAVALDNQGLLAAATSTGGTGMKLPGRVGDSPVPGAGNYADRHGAASGTGTGERLMRTLLAFRVVQAMGGGDVPSRALEQAFRDVRAVLGKEVGVIAVDSSGNVGVHHTTPAMPHGYASAAKPRPILRLRAR